MGGGGGDDPSPLSFFPLRLFSPASGCLLPSKPPFSCSITISTPPASSQLTVSLLSLALAATLCPWGGTLLFLMTHDACLGSRANGEGVNVCLRVMHLSSLLVCAKACNHKEKISLKKQSALLHDLSWSVGTHCLLVVNRRIDLWFLQAGGGDDFSPVIYRVFGL